MVDEQPIDYVTAAIAYLLLVKDDIRTHATVEVIHLAVNEYYDVDLPWTATFAALTALEGRGVLTLPTNRYGPGYIEFPQSYRDELVKLRFFSGTPVGKVLDIYMNGLPTWMHDALTSPRFARDLQAQLTPLIAENTGKGDRKGGDGRVPDHLSPDAWIQFSHELERIRRATSAVELSNFSRSQLNALLDAASTLASAPEPPAPIIWELLNRANALAGVASLFVSILALFLS